MTTVTVQNTTRPYSTVTIDLVTNSPATGVDGSGNPINSIRFNADSSGAWSQALADNSTISPAGSYYRAREITPDGYQTATYFVVPNSGGPYSLAAVAITAPSGQRLSAPAARASLGAQAGRPHPAVSGVVSALQRGRRSICIQNTGDSTGDAPNEWFGLLGTLLGQRYPAYTVLWRGWSDTNQAYDPMPTVLQAGAAGDRYYDIRSSVGFYLPGGNITGDTELMARVRPDAWTGSTQCFIAKYDATTNQRGMYFWLDGAGKLNLTWSTDGVTPTTSTSTVAVPFSAGTIGWVRVRHVVSTGGNNQVLFFTSTDGVTYTQLGATVTNTGTTSHFASSANWTLGFRNAGAPSDYFVGRIYEVRIQSGAGSTAYDVMPVLPEFWEPTSTAGSANYTLGGAPVLYLYCGSQSGQNVSYFDNSARRPKVFANLGQRVLFVNTAMNDSGLWSSFATGTYQTWLTNVRTLLPGVPFACMGQNPITTGALIVSQDEVDQRYGRNAALLQWAASGAVPGTWPVDTFAAWPPNITPYLDDGYLHPSRGLSGGAGLVASYLLNGLFGSATT